MPMSSSVAPGLTCGHSLMCWSGSCLAARGCHCRRTATSCHLCTSRSAASRCLPMNSSGGSSMITRSSCSTRIPMGFNRSRPSSRCARAIWGSHPTSSSGSSSQCSSRSRSWKDLRGGQNPFFRGPFDGDQWCPIPSHPLCRSWRTGVGMAHCWC